MGSFDWFLERIPGLTYGGAVDDIVIGAQVTAIDGVNGILGSAGALYYNTATNLPISGTMQFDIADVAGLIANGSFKYVVLHEMGHVLGFSSGFWPSAIGGCGGVCTPDAVSATHTAGATGICNAAMKAAELGLVAALQLETNGGGGTACSHWDEVQLCNEIMTGYLSAGTNYLSKITLGAMQDLGYQVDYTKADSFNPNTCSAGSLRDGSSSTIWDSSKVLRPVSEPLPPPGV
eukprot:TRINITY_DN20510_c0_g1_i1.p1 TRINITY_DN20510_c0_g1~~TRINITY_DN20510_c0_g1_i1.p1  ORF type:complete len:254 (-),score=58.13 TRINITY_DN20510_c0_g1_i1:428-1129(-)